MVFMVTSHWPVATLGFGWTLSVISFEVPESKWNREPHRGDSQADQVSSWASLIAKKKVRPLSLLGEPQRCMRNSLGSWKDPT